ncbi:hypothetical protein TrRE_jg288, partial [Triparma retinervis]
STDAPTDASMDAPTAASTGAPTAASTDAPAEGKPNPKSTNVVTIAAVIAGLLFFILIAYFIYNKNSCGSAQADPSKATEMQDF